MKANVYFSFKIAILHKQQHLVQNRHTEYQLIERAEEWASERKRTIERAYKSSSDCCCCCCFSFRLRSVSFRFWFVRWFVPSYTQKSSSLSLTLCVWRGWSNHRCCCFFFYFSNIIRIKPNTQNGRTRYAIGSKFSNATTHTRRYVKAKKQNKIQKTSNKSK